MRSVLFEIQRQTKQVKGTKGFQQQNSFASVSPLPTYSSLFLFIHLYLLLLYLQICYKSKIILNSKIKRLFLGR